MLIIKKQPSLSNTNSSVEEEKATIPTPFCNVFLFNWSNAGSKYQVLRTFWAVLLPEESMPDSVHHEILKNRLAYEFMAMDYKIAGVSLPEKCRINLEASRKYDVKLMHKDMRGLTEIAIQKQEEGGEHMATKAKKENKTSKTGVAAFYLEIFENQKSAQLTDEQIADVIEKKTGNRPISKGVASYRCYFNAGTIKGQKTAPKEKVSAVRPAKEPKAKKPMSEATKAKLKEYSAKKKALKIGKKK
jgi:hypothetical protein